MLNSPRMSASTTDAGAPPGERRLLITLPDAERLLLQSAFVRNRIEEEILHDLESSIRHSIPVPPESIPAGVVTMNSRVRLRDVESGRVLEVTLAFPACANRGKGQISVLTPLGAALLGTQPGSRFTCPLAGALATLVVEEILYQPEAHGDYFG